MTINDFLSGLTSALEGELPPAEIVGNLKYYKDYMESQRAYKSEEEITSALGDPRLIAKTIIETYKMNTPEARFQESPRNQYQDYSESSNGQTVEREQTESNSDGRRGMNRNMRFLRMPGWAAGVIGIVVLILIFSLFFWIGGIVMKLVFRFGLPLLLIYLVYTLIRNRGYKK